MEDQGGRRKREKSFTLDSSIEIKYFTIRTYNFYSVKVTNDVKVFKRNYPLYLHI